eukprot:Protomagalhaensia_wolfi_Nauph_80__5772@NODE_708_length_2086_cov_61_260381_g530_i0_p1_GENE_NODE_708_length_2086_cov_61_260381_g530_i0NODE_708_length_2086_cov_61_260381_g530_i0_p1_ORF_typecomplete_len391_score13_31Methyltransf_23/PF13489_6/1_8e24Methyltransf_31/PF13847_6/2_3e20Methyltransf_31/PF13847_6/5_1e03Methyltransf_11/PF08241_12/2_3e13Methyltransf_12/PF08242_12/1_8e13MetW/PF07021_12/0_00015MetW/PF07021_12/0_00012Methyltransf_9/PF08003_11/3_3e10Methyltransf_25/PF13649_6/4e10CMAS/PF02353_20/0_
MHLSTVDPLDGERWSGLSDHWHGDHKKFDALRLYAPLRVNFLQQALTQGRVKPSFPRVPGAPLSGFSVLDIGCGGGYLSQALAEAGAHVLGVDCNGQVIQDNCRRLPSDYAHSPVYLKSTIEDLAKLKHAKELNSFWNFSFLNSLNIFSYLFPSKPIVPPQGFDVVIASEVIEHVKHPRYFLSCADELLKPNGILMITTPNRTRIGKFAMITMAEDVLKLAPKGVHDFRKFIRHDEIAHFLNADRCEQVRRATMGIPAKPESIPKQLDTLPDRFCYYRQRLMNRIHTLSNRDVRCLASPIRRFWLWPRMTLRQAFLKESVSPKSPLYPCPTKDDSRVTITSMYRHIDTSGVLFFPKLNFWSRVPFKNVAYMTAFKKSRDSATCEQKCPQS